METETIELLKTIKEHSNSPNGYEVKFFELEIDELINSKLVKYKPEANQKGSALNKYVKITPKGEEYLRNYENDINSKKLADVSIETNQKILEESIDTNKISKEANNIAIEANKIAERSIKQSQRANRNSIIAIVISVLVAIITIILFVIEHVYYG